MDTATEALMPGAFLVDLIPARKSDLDSRLTVTLIYNHPSKILASMGPLYDVSSSRGLRTYPNQQLRREALCLCRTLHRMFPSSRA